MKSNHDAVMNQLAQLQGTTVDAVTPSKQVSVYLLLDTSSSMLEDDKINQAKSGAKGCAEDSIARGAQFGLIEFHSDAQEVVGLSRDLNHVMSSIDAVEARGSTDMTSAIRMATQKLKGVDGRKIVFIVTDGMPNNEDTAFAAASEAHDAGIRIETRGVDDANLRVLRKLSSNPDQAQIVPKGLLTTSIKALAKRIDQDDDHAGLSLLD